MTTVFDSLPEPLRQQAAERATQLGLPAEDTFLLALIDDVGERRKALEAFIVEGLNSGPAIPMNEAFWDDLLREHEEQMRQGEAQGHDAPV